jgi:hypothetical protein
MSGAPLLRAGRQELLDRIADLEALVAKLETENTRLARDHATMLETLTHAQARGSELQDEARALRRVLRTHLSLPTLMGVDLVQRDKQFEILIDLLKVRWRGDAKYGGAEAHADLPLSVGDASFFAREQLTALRRLRCEKDQPTGYRDWLSILMEEWLELISEDGSDEARIEAEAIDVANVCLKMVEAIRIRRERVKGAT